MSEAVVVENGQIGWQRGDEVIWIGSKVEAEVFGNVYRGKVVFENGAFSLRVEEKEEKHYQYDLGQVIPLASFTKITLLESPELTDDCSPSL